MFPKSLPPTRTRSTPAVLTVLMVVFTILVSPLPLAQTLAQSTKTRNLNIRVGQESDEQILAELPAGAVFDALASKQPSIATFDQNTRKFKGVSKGSEDYKIVYREGEKVHSQDGKITVQGVKKWIVNLKGKEYDGSETIRFSQGSKANVEGRAVMDNGDEIKSEVSFESDKPAVFVVDTSSSPAKLEAKGLGDGTLTLKLGKEEKKFSVEVLEPIDKAKSLAVIGTPKIELAEGASDYTIPSLKFKTITDKDVSLTDPGRDFAINVTDAGKKELIAADGYKIRANLVDSKKYPDAKVTVNAEVVTQQGIKADGSSEALTFPIELEVVVQEATVKFESPLTVLLEDANATLKAYISARDGQPMSNMKVKDFSFVRACDEKFVELIEDPENNSVTVVRRLLDTSDNETLKNCGDNEPSTVAIEASAQKIDGTGPTYKGRTVLRLRRIKGFHPLSVKINIMDKQTAEDLYGRVASNEYYILTVRMFNDLKDDETGKYTGDAIIVYSASIELAVNLEKQYDDKSESAKKKTAKPKDPNPKDSYIADGRWYEVDTEQDLKGVIDDRFVKGPIPKNLKELRYNVDNQDPICTGTITYRPLTFEMVVNTVDRRDKRSRRSRVFDGLELVGLGAAFSSAIRFPGRGRDLPIVTDSFSNLLIPGLEKIFPSFKEQNRQNIVSQVMKPLEEVPFGSDLTRVLFVPKRSIRGIVPDHKTRISQICPFYFKVQVAVIDKKGQTTVEQGARQ
jgi:hypothetical protein